MNDRDQYAPTGGAPRAGAKVTTTKASSGVSHGIRQTHRWLSIVFTMTVIANFLFMALGTPPAWVVYSPLPPLFLMLISGLYMFVLPYVVKRRAPRTVE